VFVCLILLSSFDQWITVFSVIANLLVRLPHSLMQQDYQHIRLVVFGLSVNEQYFSLTPNQPMFKLNIAARSSCFISTYFSIEQF